MGDTGVMKLDLLLVNAPSRAEVYGDLADISAIEPPVWAGLIATYCLQLGFAVQILDAEAEGLTVAETAARIKLINPMLAVYVIYGHQPSASTQCMPAAIAVAKIVDESASTILQMAMGTHPSALPERTSREGPFDYVCQGEGPITISELLAELKNG